MLKNILNLKGVVQLNREQQKSIFAGNTLDDDPYNPHGGTAFCRNGEVKRIERFSELSCNQACYHDNGMSMCIGNGY
ncbi:hypothetical protein [Paucihalobacter sp.]|uniref:hypothetical protein n=1 Tax=Paucihalobacter sp. TaxID=2850405 RepID=UPI003D161B38